MIDWQQALVSVGTVAVTAILVHAKKSGADDKRMENFEGTSKDHGRRLDEHDDRFEELNVKFVPRQELKETMDAIQKSQDRTERWLEALIMPRVNPIGTAAKANEEK
jgi:FtsZ-interacting cell division protein ZipA